MREAPILRQYGVLAFKRAADELQILLITSRDTGRWVVPRGNLIAGLLPHEAAAQEAWEEAGVTGTLHSNEIGTYRYGKRRKSGAVVPAEVHLFAMEVLDQQEDWPERGQRTRKWFGRAEAAARVDEADLKILILAFDPR